MSEFIINILIVVPIIFLMICFAGYIFDPNPKGESDNYQGFSITSFFYRAKNILMNIGLMEIKTDYEVASKI